MKKVSNRVLLAKLGDSKIGIHEINENGNFILTIQDINSANFMISGKENNEYKIIKEEEGVVGDYTLIENINYNQLEEFAKLLSIKYPDRETK